MKKLLILIGSMFHVTTASATVVACGIGADYHDTRPKPKPDKKTIKELEKTTPIIVFGASEREEKKYNEIVQIVNEQIMTLGWETDVVPKVDIDYTIDKSSFSSMGVLITPGKIVVTAREASELLEGSFTIRTVRNVQERIDLGDFTTEGSFDVGELQKEKIIKLIREAVPKAELNVDYQIINFDDGSWTIKEVNENSLIRISFTYKTQKTSLLNIKHLIKEVTVKDNFDELQKEIINKIKAAVPGANQSIDYNISGNTNNADSSILVEATSGSKYLKDSFVLDVKKFDIRDLQTDTLTLLHKEAEIIQEVEKTLVKINPEFIEVSANDFTVTRVEGVDEKLFTIKANENSKLLTGSFNINLEKIDIIKAKPFFNLDKKFNLATGEWTLKEGFMDVIVNNLFTFKGETEPRASWEEIGDFVLWQVGDREGHLEFIIEESKLLTGSFDFYLGPVELSEVVKIQPLEVGDMNTYEVTTQFEDQVNAYFSTAKLKPGVDYIVEDHTDDLTHSGDIIISATPSTKIISGSVTIKVNKRSIEGVQLFDQAISLDDQRINSETKFKDLIANKINDIFKEKSLEIRVDEKDYQFLNSQNKVVDLFKKPQAGTFTLKAVDESKLISGSFKFTIGKIDLSELGDVEPIEVEDNLQQAIDNVLDRVQKLAPNTPLIKGIDYEIIDNTNNAQRKGKVVIKGLEENSNLTGSVTIQVEPKKINSLEFDAVFLKDFVRDQQSIRNQAKIKIRSLFKDIEVKDSDFEILNPDNTPILEDQKLFAGTYHIAATENSLIIDKAFSFKVLSDDISSLGEYFSNKEWTITTPKEVIHDAVNAKLKEFTGQDVVEGVDYEFISGDDSATKDKVVFTVQGIEEHGVIKGSFIFEVGKQSIVDIKIDPEETIFANDPNPENFIDVIKTKINQKLGDNKESVELNRDFSVGNMEDWFREGQITVTAFEDSKLISGSFTIQIKKVSFDNVRFAKEYNFGMISKAEKEAIEQEVQKEVDTLFAGAWHETQKPHLGVDYEIVGFGEVQKNSTRNNDYPTGNGWQWLSSTAVDQYQLGKNGKNGIVVRTMANSKLVSGNFGINVKTNWTQIDGKNAEVYAITNNYSLTSAGSVWKPLGQTLENTNETNYIREADILEVNNNFLVTSQGIYFGAKLIETNHKNPLTMNDIIFINDNVIITTYGSWYLEQLTDINYQTAELLKIQELSNLKPSDFLGVSQNLIITTQGIWIRKVIGIVDNSDKTILFEKIKNQEEDFDHLTSHDLITFNDNFLVTRKGIWTKKTPISSDLTMVVKKEINYRDVISIGTSAITIKNIGVISIDATIVEPDNQEKQPEIIAQTNNYLVTAQAIYWKGSRVGEFGARNKVLAVNDDFLVTDFSGVYYHGVKNQNRVEFNALGNEPILGMNSSFLVTRRWVQFKGYEGAKGRVDNAMNGNNATNEIYQISKTAIAILGRYTYVLSDDSSWILNGNYVTYNWTFVALNDYYVVFSNYITWYFDGINQPRNLYTKYHWTFIGLYGRFLVTTDGIYKDGRLLANSQGLTKDDILFAKDDILVTKRGIF